MENRIFEIYKTYGIDVDKAIKELNRIPISLHCWQLDDVAGLENTTAQLTGGIQATGNYIGKARNFDELVADFDKVLEYVPGIKRLNLHASYQASSPVERSDIGMAQYAPWIKYAKERNIALDFNPTIFASSMLKNGLSLSSPNAEVREYWIRHVINAIKVSEGFGRELGIRSLCNIWIPDGYKDIPADRLGPRIRLKQSLDLVLSQGYNRDFVDISVESKVFGIGVESYTVGSHEFYLNYAAQNGIICLLDTGHFHPTENVADKISSMLAFYPRLALHVSRPVRWDSDHVLRLNDELQDIADELVKNVGPERYYLGLDFFDASINRIAALIIGARNMRKALLRALLTPWHLLKELQDNNDLTRLFALQEEIKTLPWTDVWNHYLEFEGQVNDEMMYRDIKKHEKEILSKRGNNL